MSFEEVCKKHGGNFYVKLISNPKRHEYKKKPVCEWTDEDMQYAQLDVIKEESKRKARQDALLVAATVLIVLAIVIATIISAS